MINERFLRRALIAAVAVSVSCGDSTAPDPIDLTEEQVDDMMDAFSALQTAPDLGSTTAMFTLTQNRSVDCPNGGSYSDHATVTGNDAGTTLTFSSTQDFNACKATSSSGRLWTFNGSPRLTTNFTFTVNPQTEAFSMTGSQTGGLLVSSDLGSGSCTFNVSYTLNSTPVPGSNGESTITGSVSGTVCGRSIEVDLSVLP